MQIKSKNITIKDLATLKNVVIYLQPIVDNTTLRDTTGAENSVTEPLVVHNFKKSNFKHAHFDTVCAICEENVTYTFRQEELVAFQIIVADVSEESIKGMFRDASPVTENDADGTSYSINSFDSFMNTVPNMSRPPKGVYPKGGYVPTATNKEKYLTRSGLRRMAGAHANALRADEANSMLGYPKETKEEFFKDYLGGTEPISFNEFLSMIGIPSSVSSPSTFHDNKKIHKRGLVGFDNKVAHKVSDALYKEHYRPMTMEFPKVSDMLTDVGFVKIIDKDGEAERINLNHVSTVRVKPNTSEITIVYKKNQKEPNFIVMKNLSEANIVAAYLNEKLAILKKLEGNNN